MKTPKKLLIAAGVLAFAVVIGSGCATKGYVREQVTPVEQRANELAKKNADAIAQLDEKTAQATSRVEERAVTAEAKATAAGRAAEQAQQSANQANEAANNVRSLAQQTETRLGEVTNYLEIAEKDRYKLVSNEAVLFGFNRATLTPEGRQVLDALAGTATGLDRYIIEVQGFTDRSGSADYNLALSRRRADAVVRYLVSKDIPLRRIHQIGLGVKPSEEVETAREARRVEVSIYAPEATIAGGGVSTAKGNR